MLHQPLHMVSSVKHIIDCKGSGDLHAHSCSEHLICHCYSVPHTMAKLYNQGLVYLVSNMKRFNSSVTSQQPQMAGSDGNAKYCCSMSQAF